MADEDWTVPKKLGTDYTDPYQRDHDKVTVTRGYVMWLMRESARLSRQVQVVELQNIELKAEVERLRKAGDAMASSIQFNEEMEQDYEGPTIVRQCVKDWNAAKEGNRE